MTAASLPLQWAHYYQSLGLPVLPVYGVVERDGALVCACGKDGCRSPGKHPVPHNGVKSRSHDSEVARTWWTDMPDASIAIATGTHLAIIDVDPAKGGLASLERMRRELGDALDTPWVVDTGGGGLHLGFRGAPGVRNPVGFLPGIDLRAEGGYVVAPPSRHISGKPYQWRCTPLPPLDTLPPLPDVGRFRRSPGPPDDNGAHGLVGEGRRNATIASVAGALRRSGAGPEAIAAVAAAVNLKAFEKPLATEEVNRTVRSVSRYAPTDAASMVFITSRELATKVPAEVPWVLTGVLVAGAITELVGAPKVGKTTLTYDMLAAVLGIRPFMDRVATVGPVVLMTEESDTSLMHAIGRSGVVSENLHILRQGQARGMQWPTIVDAVIAKATEVGAKLIVVDTLPAWSLAADLDENSASDALRAFEPLRTAADAGFAVLTIRHQRKGGGAVVDAGRGSSAYSGITDIVLGMQPAAGRATARVIEARSRFPIPDRLVIDRTSVGYISYGQGEALVRDTQEAAVVGVLPLSEADAIEVKTIVSKLATTACPLRPTAVRTVVERLLKRNSIARRGDGTRHAPYTFWQSTPTAAGV